jgi:hypothetical protein
MWQRLLAVRLTPAAHVLNLREARGHTGGVWRWMGGCAREVGLVQGWFALQPLLRTPLVRTAHGQRWVEASLMVAFGGCSCARCFWFLT